MNPLVSDGGNTTVGTKDPGSTTKEPDPVTVTEEPKSTTGSSSQGDQTMFISTTSSIQVWIVEVPVDMLTPVTNVFVMNKEK